MTGKDGGAPSVVFSHDIFTAQTAGGVSRCHIELMRALTGLSVDWRCWAGAQANEMLAEAAREERMGNRIVSSPGPARGRIGGALGNEPAFARWFGRSGARILHRTYYPILDLAGRKAKRIETLHDMWDERSRHKDDRGASVRSWVKRRALSRADLIACVSEHTRAELLAIWPWAEARSTVIHHGVRRLSAAPVPAGLDRPYFLFVGRRGLYKNFHVAVEALRLSGLTDDALVCFGGGPFSKEEARSLGEAGLEGRVHLVGGGDDRLAGLYEGATALLYPSSYEGFGLPLLEAMIHGCPVVAAPLTSLPEVGGDAALYADPEEPDQWAAAMRRLATDRDAVAGLIALGRARSAQFGWDKAARAYASGYARL